MSAGRRLRQKSHFERLLLQGTRRTLNGYTFYLGRRQSGQPRLGLLVTRRHAARANVRNLIKRCIREAFRLEQHRLGPLDVLVRPPLGTEPSAGMVQGLRQMFGRLGE